MNAEQVHRMMMSICCSIILSAPVFSCYQGGVSQAGPVSGNIVESHIMKQFVEGMGVSPSSINDVVVPAVRPMKIAHQSQTSSQSELLSRLATWVETGPSGHENIVVLEARALGLDTDKELPTKMIGFGPKDKDGQFIWKRFVQVGEYRGNTIMVVGYNKTHDYLELFLTSPDNGILQRALYRDYPKKDSPKSYYMEGKDAQDSFQEELEYWRGMLAQRSQQAAGGAQR